MYSNNRIIEFAHKQPKSVAAIPVMLALDYISNQIAFHKAFPALPVLLTPSVSR